jgi:hypothetical protein
MSDIRMDWESYNVDQEDRKLLDVVVAYGDAFPLKDADGNEVVGGGAMSNDTPPTWDRSHTPSTEGTSSSLKSMSVSGWRHLSFNDMTTYFYQNNYGFNIITTCTMCHNYGFNIITTCTTLLL